MSVRPLEISHQIWAREGDTNGERPYLTYPVTGEREEGQTRQGFSSYFPTGCQLHL